MSSRPAVRGFGSVDELEDTIEKVYSKADRLEKEMDILDDQAENFLNYSHDSDMLKGSAEYVEAHIADEAAPRITLDDAMAEFEDPEKAENWELLEEAVEKTRGLSDQYRDTYESLWGEMGYSGDDLREKVDGSFPMATFLRNWEASPHTFFQEQESYDDWRDAEEATGSRPTMARYFELSEEDLTMKQRDDLTREQDLDKEDSRERHGRTFEDMDFQFWRNHLSRNNPDNPYSAARWVNKEKMLLENTLEGEPASFAEKKK